jgi:hypothetical protein
MTDRWTRAIQAFDGSMDVFFETYEEAIDDHWLAGRFALILTAHVAIIVEFCAGLMSAVDVLRDG